MTKQFSACTLEDAYELAAKQLQISIINLDVKIIQKPKSGLFGFFTKDAIILVSFNNTILNTTTAVPFCEEDDIINDITNKINSLFFHTCFKIDEIVVSKYDEKTILIEFTGEDAPLLIGKEGYRYKALSYILFNWILDKYSMTLRLEIASFLKSQEDFIYSYLEPFIKDINNGKMIKTKPLDGVLVHIALKYLREKFPNKYVAIKTNIKGDKYVLVNEYRK
jgi:predicted RNA-binding protein Jag